MRWKYENKYILYVWTSRKSWCTYGNDHNGGPGNMEADTLSSALQYVRRGVSDMLDQRYALPQTHPSIWDVCCWRAVITVRPFVYSVNSRLLQWALVGFQWVLPEDDWCRKWEGLNTAAPNSFYFLDFLFKVLIHSSEFFLFFLISLKLSAFSRDEEWAVELWSTPHTWFFSSFHFQTFSPIHSSDITW